jgi:hypothetical protein
VGTWPHKRDMPEVLMLKRSRSGLGTAAVAAALAIAALGAGPAVALAGGGDLSVQAHVALVDKDGTITLRAKYVCSQYDAPYDGTDVLIASITSSAGGYDTFTSVTCDGTKQHVTLTMAAFDGGTSGSAILQLGHEGISPDGTTGTISVFVDVPVKVVTTGPE